MGYLLLTINTGDRLAAYWRQGLVTAIAAQELLADLGFTGIDFKERSIIGFYNGVRFELDGTFVSQAMEAA